MLPETITRLATYNSLPAKRDEPTTPHTRRQTVKVNLTDANHDCFPFIVTCLIILILVGPQSSLATYDITNASQISAFIPDGWGLLIAQTVTECGCVQYTSCKNSSQETRRWDSFFRNRVRPTNVKKHFGTVQKGNMIIWLYLSSKKFVVQGWYFRLTYDFSFEGVGEVGEVSLKGKKDLLKLKGKMEELVEGEVMKDPEDWGGNWGSLFFEDVLRGRCEGSLT